MQVPGGSGVRVALTPAQHWSSRSGWDRRRTLWGSWAVLGPRHRYWFSGEAADAIRIGVLSSSSRRYGLSGDDATCGTLFLTLWCW